MPDQLRKEEEFMYKYLQQVTKRPKKKDDDEESDDHFDGELNRKEDTDPEMEAFA